MGKKGSSRSARAKSRCRNSKGRKAALPDDAADSDADVMFEWLRWRLGIITVGRISLSWLLFVKEVLPPKLVFGLHHSDVNIRIFR